MLIMKKYQTKKKMLIMKKYFYDACTILGSKIEGLALKAKEKVPKFSCNLASFFVFLTTIDPAKKIKDTTNKFLNLRFLRFAFRIALAMTIIVTVYFVEPVSKQFKLYLVWPSLIDFFVMDYTVGGTVARNLSRLLGSSIALILAAASGHIAAAAGTKVEPILLGLTAVTIFVVRACLRRIPFVVNTSFKYCVTVFAITFVSEAVTSYREKQVLRERFIAIAIEAFSCIFISVFIFPVWSGDDLHKLVAKNLERLPPFLEEHIEADPVITGNLESFLQFLLDSKDEEGSLANFASWEELLRHGQFRFRHPWEEYLKVASLIRECAFSIKVLSTYFTDRNTTEPITGSEWQKMTQSACAYMRSEWAKALSDLASSIQNKSVPSAAHIHISNAQTIAKNIDTRTESSSGQLHIQVVKLHIQVVENIFNIEAAVQELAHTAGFEQPIPEAPLPDQSVSGGSIHHPVAAAVQELAHTAGFEQPIPEAPLPDQSVSGGSIHHPVAAAVQELAHTAGFEQPIPEAPLPDQSVSGGSIHHPVAAAVQELAHTAGFEQPIPEAPLPDQSVSGGSIHHQVAAAVQELAHTAGFEQPIPEAPLPDQSFSGGSIHHPVADGGSPHVAIDIDHLCVVFGV